MEPCMVAVCGLNGAGKTTLLRALAGILPITSGQRIWNQVSFEIKRPEIAYIPQKKDMDSGFPMNVLSWVESGRYSHCGLWRRFSKQDNEIVQSALQSTQIEPIKDQSLNTLSGGQLQRAYIARALAQEAKLILMDEPLEGLDEGSRTEVLKTMRTLVDHGAIILASLHNQNTCRSSFTYCAWIEAQGMKLSTNNEGCFHNGLA